MDKALKQRLVGASVLIALAVIVLPMLLGGPTESGQQQSQQIDLPSSPEGISFETRRFPLAEEGAATQSGRAAATQQTQPSDPADTAEPGPASGGTALETAKAQPDATDKNLQMAPTAEGTSPDIEIAGTESADKTESPEKIDEGLPPVATVEATVSEKVDLPVEVVPAESKSQPAGIAGRFAVQVASLSSEANSKKLQSNLETMGYQVIADRIESDVGRLHRVRVGPFATEAEANAAVKKIQNQLEGVSPRTVDLNPAAATQVVNPSDPLVRWVVQLGSFGESTNADNLVKQVRAQGLSAYSERVTSSAGAAINRVRVGPFLQREDASKAQQQLKSSLSINGVVMSAE